MLIRAPTMHPLNQRVEQAFAAWRDHRQSLQDASKALEAALDAFAHGAASEPVELRARVDQLRAECDALFSDVLAAVAAAKDAGVR